MWILDHFPRFFTISRWGVKWHFAVMAVHALAELCTGWPQSRRKIPEFSRLFQSKNLLSHRLLQQKVNVIMTFINGHDDPVYLVNSCFTQIFEWRTKNTLFVIIFLRLHRIHRIPWEFPEFSMFREIPEYSRFSGFVTTLYVLYRVLSSCTCTAV